MQQPLPSRKQYPRWCSTYLPCRSLLLGRSLTGYPCDLSISKFVQSYKSRIMEEQKLFAWRLNASLHLKVDGRPQFIGAGRTNRPGDECWSCRSSETVEDVRKTSLIDGMIRQITAESRN